MSTSLAVLDRIALYAILVDSKAEVRFVNAALKAVSALGEGATFSPATLPDGQRLVRPPSAKDMHFTTAMPVDGQNRLIEWSPSPVSEDEILYIGKDVTRERRSYAALKETARSAANATETKMRFLATMSHEMRTPLNGILGMNGLLLDTNLDANQRTYADAVRQSGMALLGLINDILDYSKIEAGHLELEEHWFDPAGLLQGVTELLSPRAAEKGVEIAACLSKGTPQRLYGDEGRLRQVLLNLAGNGVKFTERGGISVELTCTPGDRPDVFSVRFDIIDTGVGISESDLQSIFEEFTQVDDSASTKQEGTGLGLAIARQIVQAMGGQIDVTSEFGHGSTFSFTLNMNGASEKASSPAPDFSGLSVIIASDQPFLSRVVTQQLETLGVGTVLQATSSRQTFALLEEYPSATLLCDLPIAATEGTRLADTSPNAIVLLSPLARGRLEAFRQAGFDGYLIKPIRQSSLCERLVRTTSNETPSRQADRLDTVDIKRTPEPEGQRLRILLAEDNQINSVLAQAILKRAGHHVDVAANGQEAVDTFALAPYDVVLMDMRMPIMDGMEATRRIRIRDAETPIIALTANSTAADRRDCLEAGMNDFISKPIDPADLNAAVMRWASNGNRTIQAEMQGS